MSRSIFIQPQLAFSYLALFSAAIQSPNLFLFCAFFMDKNLSHIVQINKHGKIVCAPFIGETWLILSFGSLQRVVQSIASARLDASKDFDLHRLCDKLIKNGIDCKLYHGRPCMLRIVLFSGYTVQIYPSGKVTIFRCASNLQLIAAFLTIHNTIFNLEFNSICIQTMTCVGEYEFYNASDRFFMLKPNSGCRYKGFTVSYNAETFPQAVSLRCSENTRLFANLFCSRKLVVMGPRNFEELRAILSCIDQFLKHSFSN